MFHSDVMRHRDVIDFLEVPTVEYINRSRRVMQDPTGAILREARAAFPCVAHGISLSVGTVGVPQTGILERTRSFLDEYELDEFSDHLTFHRAGGKNLSVFLSMPFDEAAATWVAHQYNASKALLGQPFGLEIVTYPFEVADSQMSEVQFINRVAELTDAWFLLDVANLFYNSSNHRYDPIAFLKQLPTERIQHMHIAGGHKDGDEWIDSHDHPVHEDVFDLLADALTHTDARAIILERDEPPDSFGPIASDLARAKEIFLKHRPAELPTELAAGAPVFEAAQSAPVFTLDDLPPEIAGLKQYQEALIGCVFDMADGRYHNHPPQKIVDEFALPEDWRARWGAMDWAHMEKLRNKLLGIRKFEEKAAHYYRMAELAQWAQRSPSFAPGQT